MSICNNLFPGTTDAIGKLISKEESPKKINCCSLSARIMSLGCAILYLIGSSIPAILNFAAYYKDHEIKVISFCLDLVALLVSVVPATVVKVVCLVLGGIIHPAIAVKYTPPTSPAPTN